ncbi:conserved hypothetical protein [Renibacterium salmoninarum ATCC 33209]|uniref:Uncharacterized protein n=2 Tax=Renibacterium salmoninarum TaxID=1646 RepID=A9WQV3_RENSM|nr:conserved hypothetical protein [Renibacterium salmoninarum ATCC 33209]
MPLAEQLMKLRDKLPEGDLARIRNELLEQGKKTIPIYKDKESIGIEGKVAWVTGGAHLASEITQNADGSATLKLSGDIGVGAKGGSGKTGIEASLTG